MSRQKMVAAPTAETSAAGEELAALPLCDNCGNPIESCMCVCPYCGKKDACECCLYDAATGG